MPGILAFKKYFTKVQRDTYTLQWTGETPCTFTLLVVERDTPCKSIFLAVGRDTPCTSTQLAEEKDTHIDACDGVTLAI
jgi:hypothetical protein